MALSNAMQHIYLRLSYGTIRAMTLVTTSKVAMGPAFAVLAGALTACGATYPDDLSSLQSDPMAAAELSGAKVSRTSETDAEVGGLMGKPRAAEVQVVYAVNLDADAESVKAEAVAQAEAAGWDMADPEADTVLGTKTFATGDADIGIYFVEEDGQERLIIRLEHAFNHPTS